MKFVLWSTYWRLAAAKKNLLPAYPSLPDLLVDDDFMSHFPQYQLPHESSNPIKKLSDNHHLRRWFLVTMHRPPTLYHLCRSTNQITASHTSHI